MVAARRMVFESTFATYRRVRQIGVGGSGTVVEVTDQDRQTLAVKFLSPENLTTDKVKRFKNELAYCERTRHPHVVKVLDRGFVEIDDRKCPFYVMPYCPKNLRALLREGIAVDQVLGLYSQILDGVEAAHLQGVCHRDLKPENILVTSDGTLVVADFGIARFAEPLMQTLIETKQTQRMGNFQYAAPEQRTPGTPVDYRADIYALGLILNEMYTGRLAVGVAFTKIAGVDAALSYLDDLVDSMLMHSPDDRPESIAKVKQELIARRNSFVAEQRLSELRNEVVPKSEVEDVLIADPPQLVAVQWDAGSLVFTMSRPVNEQWAQIFRKPGDHSYIHGHGPETFRIKDSELRVACSTEGIAQQLTDLTKQYVTKANQNYKARVETASRERQAAEEAELRRRVEEAERAKRVNASLKL
jgi:serine/threonine protein kinase